MPTGIYQHHRSGWKHSEETKKKISKARKGLTAGKNNPMYGKPTYGFFGKHHTEEVKKKISEAKKGKGHKQTEETRKKMSEAQKGRNRDGNHKPKFHIEETKQKIRQARLKQKLPTIDTSIELKFRNWLDEKKINYIHPFNLGNRFQCDFYLPFLNLIVECDGTYWHNRPDMKKRDKAKDAYAKKCGFDILRLTEEEINKGQFLQ